MKQTLFAVLLTLTFIHNATAQKQTYDFDYAITMVEDYKYASDTKLKNYRELVHTWINSKNTNYLCKVYYNTDSTRTRLEITDFENGRVYVKFLHDIKGKKTVNKYAESREIISKLFVKTSDFKPIKPDSIISNYLCERFTMQSNGQTIYDAWFTRDIKDVPAHALHAIGNSLFFPVQYKGIAVWYQMKTPPVEASYKLVSANYVNHKVTLRGNKLASVEEDVMNWGKGK